MKSMRLAVSVLLGLFLIGLAFGLPAFARYQKRADAHNEVLVNEIRIKQQEQLIQVEKQNAEIRVELDKLNYQYHQASLIRTHTTICKIYYH